MKRIILFLVLTSLILNYADANENTSSKIRSLSLFDKSRLREIPVELYESDINEERTEDVKRPLIIMNHGHKIKNTEYTFLTNAFADRGCFVASIQHYLSTDEPWATRGSIYDDRKPIWEQGIKNILFVLEYLKETEPNLNFKKVTLVGHSNGGDISVLFATNYPNKVAAIVSLDSRRMPFPRTQAPQIISFRANDVKADDGVLPTQAEQERLGIKIVDIAGAKHMDFCDRGSSEIKQKINEVILKYCTGIIGIKPVNM